MAHNPQAPQGPHGAYGYGPQGPQGPPGGPHAPQSPQGPHAPQGSQEPDPSGSTQMFRAFVDEGSSDPRAGAASSSGSRIGVIVAVALGITVLAVVAWLALG